MIPLVTLCCMVIAGIASLDKLCLFHQTYQSVSARLESERWLLEQCSDPLFFSKMHTHSDLCFQVRFGPPPLLSRVPPPCLPEHSLAGREQCSRGGIYADLAGADPVIPDAAVRAHPLPCVCPSQRVFMACSRGSDSASVAGPLLDRRSTLAGAPAALLRWRRTRGASVGTVCAGGRLSPCQRLETVA